MADKYGKCTNFGLCAKADSREAVAISEAAGSECPECGKLLHPASGPSGGGRSSAGFPAKKAGIAAVILVALLGALYAFLPSDSGEPLPEPVPAPEPVPSPTPDPNPNPSADPIPAPLPDPGPGPLPSPDPGPTPSPVPAPSPVPLPDPNPAPAPVPPPPSPQPKPSPTPDPVVTYRGPSSGRIIWEGEIEDKEGLVTIEGSTADKGRIVSGGIPGGTPLVLALQDVRNIGIAMTPQQTSGYRRLVLRVKKGKRKAVIDWSVAQ